MDTESKNIMQEQIKKLPKEVRDALASDEISAKIRTVGNTHHLHIDQIGTLEDEVILAMIGLSELADLPDQLVEQLSISKTDADALVNDINDTVFVPIQNSMKQTDKKSVVMPSSVAAQTAASTASVPAPTAPAAPLASTDMQINAPKAQDAIAAPASLAPTAPAAGTPAPMAKPVMNIPQPEDASRSDVSVPLDVMFDEPTVSMPPKVVTPAPASTQAAPVAPTPAAVPNITAKVEPPKPAPIYKADPYREPIE